MTSASLARFSSTLLSGAAVSVAGLMGFVGLIIPHVARALVGQDYRYVLVTSALDFLPTLVMYFLIANLVSTQRKLKFTVNPSG